MKHIKLFFSRNKVCLAVILLLTSGFLIWLTLCSYRNPIVTEVIIESSKVTNPIRYVYIADLHENVFGENNQQLYDIIEEIAPDFILLGGDVINWTSENDEYAVKIIYKLARL